MTTKKNPLRKDDHASEVRCLSCFVRIIVPPKVEKITCLHCQKEWRISWVNPTFAKIRGPVWDKMLK